MLVLTVLVVMNAVGTPPSRLRVAAAIVFPIE